MEVTANITISLSLAQAKALMLFLDVATDELLPVETEGHQEATDLFYALEDALEGDAE